MVVWNLFEGIFICFYSVSTCIHIYIQKSLQAPFWHFVMHVLFWCLFFVPAGLIMSVSNIERIMPQTKPCATTETRCEESPLDMLRLPNNTINSRKLQLSSYFSSDLSSFSINSYYIMRQVVISKYMYFTSFVTNIGHISFCIHIVRWGRNPSLAKHDMPCLSKQCRSRSVGFWRSQLIWICTVCH